jgi:hypothetical protein
MRKKIVSPGASAADSQGGRGGRGVLWASGVPDLASVTSDVSVSCKTAFAVQATDDMSGPGTSSVMPQCAEEP